MTAILTITLLGFKGFPLRTFVSFVVNGFALPITRDSGDDARFRR